MGNPWYRAWVGLVSDEKIAEAALIADAPRCLVIAVWHALLESASDVDDSGSFVTTPRRIGAILYEPAARIQAVFSALEELGMIRDGHVVAWAKRQPARESGAEGAERQRRFRDRRRESGAKETGPGVTRNTLSHDVTRPETESETDISSSSRASAGATPQIDLSQARPLPKRDLLEAEARTLMHETPVVVDVDFSPISRLLHEPGVTRVDVLAGLTEARDAPGFRPVSWRQCAGWVRKAAKNRLGAALDGRQARAPPGRAVKNSDLSVCLEIAHGAASGAKFGFDAAANASVPPSGDRARAGPIIESCAVAL